MTDLEEIPLDSAERCAAHADPFAETGRCPERGTHLHLGVLWCKKHVEEVKAAELRWRQSKDPLATRTQ